MRLPGRAVNPELSSPERDVLLIETVPCSAGDVFTLTFEAAEPRWRQGVWVAVEGELVVNGHSAAQLVLWRDTAPDQVRFEVADTRDGLLRLYNVWDSGRGIRPWESQTHTSGMVRESLGAGYRYRCSDIATEPTFQALVFTLQRV